MASSKFKVCRRISENIWQHRVLSRKQSAIIWKLQRKSNRKQSDFAKQLQQRTKLSLFYGNLPIKQMQHQQVYTYLDKQRSLLLHLETRLDVILVRINFCATISTARQLIIHRKICVNNLVVNVPGFSVSNGDIISISPNSFELVQSTIKQNQHSHKKFRTKPSHLEISYTTLHAVLLYEPSQIEFPYKIDLDLLF